MWARGAVGWRATTFWATASCEHRRDHPEAVLGFEAAPLVPPEDRRTVDEQDLLHVGIVGGGVEELPECGGEEIERVIEVVTTVAAARSDRT